MTQMFRRQQGFRPPPEEVIQTTTLFNNGFPFQQQGGKYPGRTGRHRRNVGNFWKAILPFGDLEDQEGTGREKRNAYNFRVFPFFKWSLPIRYYINSQYFSKYFL